MSEERFPPRVECSAIGVRMIGSHTFESWVGDPPKEYLSLEEHEHLLREAIAREKSDQKLIAIEAMNRAVLAAANKAMAKAFEEAAKEAESWWDIFDFDSFPVGDPRRFANPNQIAERIRSLVKAARDEGIPNTGDGGHKMTVDENGEWVRG